MKKRVLYLVILCMFMLLMCACETNEPVKGGEIDDPQTETPRPTIDCIKLSHGYPGWDE